MERTSEAIEKELEETRAELDETAWALKQKLSREHLMHQTRTALEDGVHSAGALIRRHPFPTVVAGALIAGGIGGIVKRRSGPSLDSTADDAEHRARRLLGELIEISQRGSARLREGIERSVEDVEETVRSASDGGAAKSHLEHLAHQIRRGAEHSVRSMHTLSNRELALVGVIAALLGATLGTTLKARR